MRRCLSCSRYDGTPHGPKCQRAWAKPAGLRDKQDRTERRLIEFAYTMGWPVPDSIRESMDSYWQSLP